MQGQIEGLPVGVKITAIRPPKDGESYLDRWGTEKARFDHGYASFPIIGADNVYDAIDLTQVAIPEGYERSGDTIEAWFREPVVGEMYLDASTTVVASFGKYGHLTPTEHGLVMNGGHVDLRRIIVSKPKPKTKKVIVIECDVDDLLINGHGRHSSLSEYFLSELHKVYKTAPANKVRERIEEREV